MERQRRRRKVKTEAADAAPAKTCVDDVSDDLLELILLRLDSPVWIIRAASTCKRWRGIIADDGGAFLRRARSLHPPTIVGHYHLRKQDPTSIDFVPSSPPVLPDTSRFSLDFLDAARWEVKDCHGGLVLLQSLWPSYLVVCDRLTRRHRKVSTTLDQMIGRFFLLDGKDGTISASNFRVLYRSYSELRRCVFSTADEDAGWRTVQPSKDDGPETYVSYAGRVDGSLYMGWRGSLMSLDNTSLELTKVDLPSRVNMSGRNGPSAFCVIAHCAGDSTSPRIVHVRGDELEVFRRVHNGGGGGEWVLERSIHRLSEAFGRLPGYPEKYDRVLKVVVGGVGFVVLLVADHGNWRWPFCLYLDTMEVKVVPESTCYRGTMDCSVYTLPWPPVMRACTGRMSQR